MKIAVIGSGGWGTAIAILLSSRGHNVYLWSWIQEETDRLKKDRENKEFLPGVKFPDTIYCSHDMAECTDGAELIITAAPSPATRTKSIFRRSVCRLSLPMVSYSSPLKFKFFSQDFLNKFISVIYDRLYLHIQRFFNV